MYNLSVDLVELCGAVESCLSFFVVNYIYLRSKMANKVNNEEFWREFKCLYRSLPATWKVKSDLYKNRILKKDCYVQLTNKLKEIDPTADINTTKKKN